VEPGVLDVQSWDWLQQDLERLLDQTQPRARQRLSPEAFELRFLSTTVEFLELDAEATKAFENAVDEALDKVDGAREHMLLRQAENEPDPDQTDEMLEWHQIWEEFGKAQLQAAGYLLAVLDARPRHQLLREKIMKWLLRLDYGIGTATR
jgi:hypothetical protein